MTDLVVRSVPGDQLARPYNDIDVAQLTATVRALIGWPISAGEAATIVTVVLQELASSGRLVADDPDDIEATGQCCCAGCIGMGPCARADTEDDDRD